MASILETLKTYITDGEGFGGGKLLDATWIYCVQIVLSVYHLGSVYGQRMLTKGKKTSFTNRFMISVLI